MSVELYGSHKTMIKVLLYLSYLHFFCLCEIKALIPIFYVFNLQEFDTDMKVDTKEEGLDMSRNIEQLKGARRGQPYEGEREQSVMVVR